MGVYLLNVKVRYRVFLRVVFEVKAYTYNSFFLSKDFNIKLSFVTGLFFSSRRGRYEISTTATPGKPGFYSRRYPPCWSFREFMGLASWCLTLIITLVQLVNLNVIKRVQLFT